MASSLSSLSRRAVMMPGIRACVQHFRAFSSYDSTQHKVFRIITNADTSDASRLGPFQPNDPRFPLPGQVGSLPQQPQPPVTASVQREKAETCDLFTNEMAADRHFNAVENFVKTTPTEEHPLNTLNNQLECTVLDCPDLLRRDLFPEHSLRKGPLTVITISQQAEGDMSMWSPPIEQEREQLMAQFVTCANDMCGSIYQAGYWADFIDPSSGRPFFGPFTNATMFETDERYRHFGFEIDDLGCCKVIRHHAWGTRAFVGCLFTNAPLSHPVLQQLIHR